MTGETIQRDLFFEPAEHEARLATIRATMARRGIDVMLCSGPENIYYASGYQTFGFHNYQLLVIPLDGEPFLILRYLESFLAQAYSHVGEVVTWDDTDDPVAVTIAALQRRKLAEGAVGVEFKGYFFQVATYLKLKDGLARVIDGSGVVETARAVKSPAEIAFMREAARFSSIGMAAAIAEIQAGRSDQDVVAGCFSAMARAGSEWSNRDPIVTTGARSGIPHSTSMQATMASGDAVLLEISGVYRRYFSPLMRGAVIGANPRAEKLAAVCIEALNAAIEAVRPGATSGEVDLASRRVIEREGLWENYRKRTGYSVGIGFSSWVEGAIASLKEDDPTVLKPGMCFHIPVALRLYGEAGVGFSETVVVTETGVETLGHAPRELARR